MESLNKVLENWDIVLQIIGLASLIANITPNETDNKAMVWVSKVVNFFAANYNVKGIANQ